MKLTAALADDKFRDKFLWGRRPMLAAVAARLQKQKDAVWIDLGGGTGVRTAPLPALAAESLLHSHRIRSVFYHARIVFQRPRVHTLCMPGRMTLCMMPYLHLAALCIAHRTTRTCCDQVQQRAVTACNH